MGPNETASLRVDHFGEGNGIIRELEGKPPRDSKTFMERHTKGVLVNHSSEKVLYRVSFAHHLTAHTRIRWVVKTSRRRPLIVDL